jgi:glycosyltransferase involved in cell wall biosynthesis
MSIRREDQSSKIIVIDDHSTDSTKLKVLELNLTNVEVVQSAGQGVAQALNTGIQMSRTRFCVRLDADDRNTSSRGRLIIDSLNDGVATVLFSKARIKPYISGLRRPKYFRFTKVENLRWLLLVSNVILHPSVCIDRNWNHDELRYPDEKGVEDYLLWTQLITDGGKFKYIGENTIVYHRTMNATSSLENRVKSQISASALDQFMKFQLSTMGKTDKQGARIALSGGGYCDSLLETLRYYILIIRKAPPRAKVNLFHNCTIMFLKCLVLRNLAK